MGNATNTVRVVLEDGDGRHSYLTVTVHQGESNSIRLTQPNEIPEGLSRLAGRDGAELRFALEEAVDGQDVLNILADYAPNYTAKIWRR